MKLILKTRNVYETYQKFTLKPILANFELQLYWKYTSLQKISLELPEIGNATFPTKSWLTKAAVLLKISIHYFCELQCD